VEVDPQTGRTTLAVEEAPEGVLTSSRLYVEDDGAAEHRALGWFRVLQAAGQELVLEPEGQPDTALLDRLATSTGPWTLSEAEPGAWPSHYADDFQRKERLAAESFLVLDPLVSISAALAGRTWVWSLACAAAILGACLLVPRGFCGYVCPLGTLIDMFDWAVGRRVQRLRVANRGPWVTLKYGLLGATLVAALAGVLVSGYVAAIPVVTRGMVYALAPVQTGLGRGWHQAPPIDAGKILGLVVLAVVLGLGLLGPRFWCKYVCPSGAVFSIASRLSFTRRAVGAGCTRCGRCARMCPFDAIEPDYSTRHSDCTFCQTCGGACPVGAIEFVGRWEKPAETAGSASRLAPVSAARRRFLAATGGAAATALAGVGAAGVVRAFGASRGHAGASLPVRPPGSVPEAEFLRLCVRCGQCLKVCPNDVLQPQSFEQGLEGLWTPRVVANWSGCEASCNLCGQVCPTGAIRALPLEEKRAARMGLAVVDQGTCLPYAGRGACQICVDECIAAGYRAIEFVRVGTEMDALGKPLEDSGFLAPAVLAEQCVGCGLCQTRCYGINVVAKGLLADTAIRIEAGEGKEDRLMDGSYVALRRQVERQRQQQRQRFHQRGGSSEYLPDF